MRHESIPTSTLPADSELAELINAAADAAVRRLIDGGVMLPVAPGERFLDERAAAEFLAMHPQTLRKFRRRGVGPRHRTLPPPSKAVRYKISDLSAWRKPSDGAAS